MATTVRTRSGFGEILRRELERQGVSTRELARRLTASTPERLENQRRQLIRYIQGENMPGDSAREAIATALTVNPGMFAQEAVDGERRERVIRALQPLADALLAIAVEVAREGRSDDE